MEITFSIILPTKDRYWLVSEAVNSVLDQTYKSFELLLVDNNYNDKTLNCINGIKDERLRYFKTGGLDMVKNWNFGLSKVNGSNILILEDKIRLDKLALQRLKCILDKYPENDIITWNYNLPHSNNLNRISTYDVLNKYLYSKQIPNIEALPRMINSVVRTSLINEILYKSTEKNFFSYVSPDITAGWKLLTKVNSFINTNERIGYLFDVSQINEKTSHGIAAHSGKNYNYYGFNYHKLPLRTICKSTNIISNVVYNDFLTIKDNYKGNLAGHSMNIYTYGALCLYSILKSTYYRKSVLYFYKEIIFLYKSIHLKNFIISTMRLMLILFFKKK